MYIKNHRETYGPVTISYATGSASYCTPRVGGLDLRDYSQVEIALVTSTGLVSPTSLGLPQFEHLFESGRSPVAGYVSWDDVDAIRAALAALHGIELQEPVLVDGIQS